MNTREKIRRSVEDATAHLDLEIYVDDDGVSVIVSAVRRSDQLRSGICVGARWRSSDALRRLPGMATSKIADFYAFFDQESAMMSKNDEARMQPGATGLQVVRADYGHATDLSYHFPTGACGAVRIADDDVPEVAASKLAALATIIKHLAVQVRVDKSAEESA